MNSDELRVAIQRLGLSQTRAALALGLPPRTFRYYASGQLPVPAFVDYSLAWLLASQEVDNV